MNVYYTHPRDAFSYANSDNKSTTENHHICYTPAEIQFSVRGEHIT